MRKRKKMTMMMKKNVVKGSLELGRSTKKIEVDSSVEEQSAGSDGPHLPSFQIYMLSYPGGKDDVAEHFSSIFCYKDSRDTTETAHEFDINWESSEESSTHLKLRGSHQAGEAEALHT